MRWGTVVTGTRDHLGLGHTVGGGGAVVPRQPIHPPPHNTVITATHSQAVNGI